MKAARALKCWIILAGFGSLALGGQVCAGTLTVNCPVDSLQAAVDLALPGDTIQVTGTCTESVLIRNEQMRIALDGQNVATISPASGYAAFTVRGKGITICISRSQAGRGPESGSIGGRMQSSTRITSTAWAATGSRSTSFPSR